MPSLSELSTLPLAGNSLLRWLVACALFLAVLLVLLTARRIVRGYYKRLQATAHTEVLELPLQVLTRTALPFFIVVALFAAAQSLVLPPTAVRILNSAITIALFWQAGAWAVAAVKIWLDRKRQRSLATDRAAVGSLGIIGFILNLVIWGLVVLLTLDNLGVNITALVAGLGIGGIAVALAVQNVLGDLFASLSITLDRPFVVGDFLIVGDFLGSVEYIGIKSTRLRSLSGEQIVISNSDLLGSRVRNYGRMNERRVVFQTRLSYDTPLELVERIPGMIREIIEAQANTRFDRSHFAMHGVSSLEFETVYYVLSPDYNRYMDIQQAINLRLHRTLAALGVEFALPTQTLLIPALESRQDPGGTGSGGPQVRAPSQRASKESQAQEQPAA